MKLTGPFVDENNQEERIMQKKMATVCACFTFMALATVAVAGNISKPYTFSNGGTADANQVNANFDTIYQQTNVNSANIATAVKSVKFRNVTASYAYNAGNYIGSLVPVAACGTGEVLTGGTCSCSHASFNSATTNFGLLWNCDMVGNAVLGMCGTNAIVYSSAKYGPPITVTAVCASVTSVGGVAAKSIASSDNVEVDPFQAERDAAVEKIKKEQAEFFRVLQETKIR